MATDLQYIGESRPGEAGLLGAMSRASAVVEGALEEVLPRPDGPKGRAAEAMRYAVFAGGKRLRPFLTLASAEMFDAPAPRAARVAAAIEALHTYSLVHDDLPCMDDDDLRRGRPTTHKAFDDATAVLAGDGLLTLAFEILADPKTHPAAEVRIALVARLAQASGAEGMIGGQMMDMLAPGNAYDADQIVQLQRLKTGALFEFACEAGPILAQAPAADQARLRDFARDFGLLFQITDDLLDVTGDAAEIGKSAGKDEAQGKATLLGVYGLAGARQQATVLAARAAEVLAPYGSRAEALRSLLPYVLERRS